MQLPRRQLRLRPPRRRGASPDRGRPAVDDERRQNSCHIDVEGVDALYAELKPKLDTLPSGRVRAPFDRDYGQREFHVIDEGAMLIFFGEPLRR
jgi:hypothetical protein